MYLVNTIIIEPKTASTVPITISPDSGTDVYFKFFTLTVRSFLLISLSPITVDLTISPSS